MTALLCTTTSVARGQLLEHTEVVKLMGSKFELTAVSDSDQLNQTAVAAGIQEIKRIEALISSWDPKSQTSAINRAAGKQAVPVDEELIGLILRAKKVSKLTEGSFDISYAAIDPIWKFDGSMKAFPDSNRVRTSVQHINYEHIMVDRSKGHVFLKQEGMKIGFGAIGKGYAANRASKIMLQLGVENGLVNAGGDLLAWGQQASGEPWRVGIVDPNDKEKIYAWLEIKNKSVVTSGDYERFVQFDGVRYAHIIDPPTGYPIRHTKSVTIVSPDAELSDALATAVFVMGPTQGLQLVNKLKSVECLIVGDDNQIHTSRNLQLNFQHKQ
jgi:thiamine biosynthesis lipoprotein